MSRIGSAFGRGIATGALALALVACGSQVDVASSTSGTGGDGGASSSSSSVSTSSSTSSSSSGTGGSGVLPAPTCVAGEAALVAATSSDQGVVAVMHDGAWIEDSSVVPAQAFATAYVDAYHHLGVFWIGSGWKSRFATTNDGTSFDTHDVAGWMPAPGDPFAAVTTDVLLGYDGETTSLARFDPDAFDWYPYIAASAIRVTAAAPLGSTGEILVVGLGPNQELCDVATHEGAWGPVHCRDEIHPAQAVGGEIGVTLPRAAALPNGDVVVVYYHHQDQGGVTLAATTLHAGAWSTPDLASAEDTGIAFGVAGTPSGDVMVGTASGTAFARRYKPGAGWGAPISLDQHAGYNVSVAPGICGDDALIAYVGGESGKEVRVARVRGDVAEASTITNLGEEYPTRASIATRPAAAVW